MAGAVGAPIPLARQNRANTKAGYRFLSNDMVSEEPILASHFQAAAQRAATTDGLLLVLQDTTEFVYQPASPETIGYTKHVDSGRDKEGRWRQHRLCGVLMHVSLAIMLEGLPLGLTQLGSERGRSSKVCWRSSGRSIKPECRSVPRKA